MHCKDGPGHPIFATTIIYKVILIYSTNTSLTLFSGPYIGRQSSVLLKVISFAVGTTDDWQTVLVAAYKLGWLVINVNRLAALEVATRASTAL